MEPDSRCWDWSKGFGKTEDGEEYSEADLLVCYEADYGEPVRIVSIPSGHRAVLCARYDMFGVAERSRQNDHQSINIRSIVTNSVVRGTQRHFSPCEYFGRAPCIPS